ncbi:hypothetical protein ACIQCR_16755 [Streptomyces sp. NPDC093249]|uniref:hypothetical protein n=1 Tax=unclassified Streptomyces TaxID=2593676 RepID=UPI00344D1489
MTSDLRCTTCTLSRDHHAPREIAGHPFRTALGPRRGWRLSASWERRIGRTTYRFTLTPARNRPQRNGGLLLVHRHTHAGALELIHELRIPTTPAYYALLNQANTPLNNPTTQADTP